MHQGPNCRHGIAFEFNSMDSASDWSHGLSPNLLVHLHCGKHYVWRICHSQLPLCRTSGPRGHDMGGKERIQWLK